MYDTRTRMKALVVVAATLLSIDRSANGQIVINELVKDERSAGSGQIEDTREFVELYNAGSTAMDIGGWNLRSVFLVDGSEFVADAIPGGTMLAAGDYYVIGADAVPNVDLSLGATELWPNENALFELRDAGGGLVDAVAYDVYIAPQLASASAEQQAQISGGWWGQVISNNTGFPQSLSRYLDGRDTNSNGRDFGMLPLTPGASNNLPQVGAYAIPDVDGLATGSNVPGWGGSFVLPKVIDPTTVDGNNPNAIPASPQGGKAIVAWDGSGGGNMDNTNALVTSFDLYAYLDTEPFGVTATSGAQEWESTIYGIGSTDAFFANPDPTALFTAPDGVRQNGSTGIGWMYQKEEQTEYASLLLIDFNDGGNSLPAAEDWKILQTIDLADAESAWHRLGIDYDPATGDVTARYDDQTFNFTTDAGLVGTFYAGYREGLSGGVPSTARPPTFDMVITEPMEDSGDFDADSDVDGADFLAWQRGFGKSGALRSDGDANASGAVDGDDLAIWEAQMGQAAAQLAAIPEPGAMCLALLACAALLKRKPAR